tara:strand:+ start:249 stop:455 length:207 start_codon:yes stop_codon:yes gene_type:complete
METNPTDYLKTYLKATLSLIESVSAKEDSLESYIMQSSLLNSLKDRIVITHREINSIMEETMKAENPS